MEFMKVRKTRSNTFEIKRQWIKSMEKLNLYNADYETYTLKDIKENENGFECKIYAPNNFRLDDIEKHKNSIEECFNCSMEYELINNFATHLRDKHPLPYLEAKFERELTQQELKNENFYVSIIPIGHVKVQEALENLMLSATFKANGYKLVRFIQELHYRQERKITDFPQFIPNEAIVLDNDIKFRVVVSYPIIDKENLMVETPWLDEEMEYNKACWFSAERIVKDHSDYIIIIVDSMNLRKENIELVKDLCEKYNKKYLITDDIRDIRFDKVYEYFSR